MRDYSTREVADIAKVSQAQVRRWARAGLIQPRKDTRGHWRYSFQDLALLRTARELLAASVSLNLVTRTLNLLRRQMPRGQPLSSIRIIVTGGRVVVKDQFSAWEPESGQSTLNFEPGGLPARPTTAVLPKSAERSALPATAAGHYAAALDLELAGQVEAAEQAYEAALELDAEHCAARINLGRLLHQQSRYAHAEACYRRVLQIDPNNALAAFNLGVVLEDQDDGDAALVAYRRTLAIDERYADAHFNLARLLEAGGDQRAAIRHLSRFRRLTQAD